MRPLPTNRGLAPPPPGVTPNFDGPRGSLVYSTVAFLLLGISGCAICLRFFTRKMILNTLGIDDCKS